jgi:hypothetical protein
LRKQEIENKEILESPRKKFSIVDSDLEIRELSYDVTMGISENINFGQRYIEQLFHGRFNNDDKQVLDMID